MQAADNDRISKTNCVSYTSLMDRTWTAFGAVEVYFIREQALQPRERSSRFASKGQLKIDRYVWTQ